MNLNMSKFEVTLPELLNMLRESESAIKKKKPVLYISETKKTKKASKTLKTGKGKERPARPRRLAKGEMDLKMGNGARVAAVAIGEVTLHLLVFVLFFATHVMHPLRFPNNDIRAKGWQAPAGMAACSAVPAGATGYRVASARGDRQQPACKGLLTRGEVTGVALARGLAARVDCSRQGHRGSTCLRLGRKGRLLVARPQG
ncbi:hypothetical protein B296_00009867 [Ensete ventricosum]|uniref:Uncharacterized protein n=1 Tax=Ensete ventricosum TaxID=4639 RepID=A0A426YB69_ENSVE|nr:hypothetical protein B296_00009867 [Ensete ventricosum]